ncbi:uncharacterized protein LOC108742988 [Agrilus planipennis]|uniref:Uncharacterized protein LOC108742988 n=1 Tax=Agrilus planipennis TaxID=224129 RepID=A0A1W4XN23_AGRPL|nr:uncharacterized protein LOC108742988 [Agrilus planipennis]
MTDTTDNNVVYAKDAKIFQEMLMDIAKNVGDKITSCKNETDNAISSDTKRAIKKAFVENIHDKLEKLILTENLQEKFAVLNKLALSGDSQPTWRPTTGQIPLTTIRGKYLEEKKTELISKVSELKKERIELQEEVMQRRKIIEKQVKQIQKCKDTLIAEMQEANLNLLNSI